MRTKMALAVLAASTLAAGNMSAFGGVLKSESTPATSEVQTEEASLQVHPPTAAGHLHSLLP